MKEPLLATSSQRAVGCLAMSLTLALAGCGTAGPSPSSIAVEVRPASGSVLRDARAVWIAGAVSRTGALARGTAEIGLAHEGGSAVSAIDSAGGLGPGADVSEEVASAVRKVRQLELAPTRGAADLVLYFEQADRLRCWDCRQPENLWYWWGLVADRSGRELASLHGETDQGADTAARQFVKSVKDLVRRARHDRSGSDR